MANDLKNAANIVSILAAGAMLAENMQVLFSQVSSMIQTAKSSGNPDITDDDIANLMTQAEAAHTAYVSALARLKQ